MMSICCFTQVMMFTMVSSIAWDANAEGGIDGTETEEDEEDDAFRWRPADPICLFH